MKRVHLAAAVAVLGACIVGSSTLVAGAADTGRPATMKLKAVVDSFHQVDNAPEGDSQGDVLVFTQKLTDSAGKQIGTSDAYCVRTAAGKNRQCQGTFFLPKGQVFVSGPDPDGVKRHALAIVGGTRAYADARGHVTLDHKSAVEDADTFSFTR